MATVTLRSVKGSALSFTEMDGNFTNLNSDKLESLLQDTSPQLGGVLDVNNNAIVSTANTNITITPDGTGSIVLDGLNWPQTDGTVGQTIVTNGTGQLSWASAAGVDAINDLSDVDTTGLADGDILAYNNTSGNWEVQPGVVYLDDLSVTTGAASGDGALAYNNLTGVFTFNPADTSTLLENLVEDLSPQLGGALDVNGFGIQSVANGDIVIAPNGTGVVDLQGHPLVEAQLEGYRETIYTAGATTGTITPDPQNGNVQKITLTGNITFNAFGGTPTAGDSMTLIITQSITGGETLTSTMMFAGGNKTLSVDPDAIDILTVFYDGTDYYASLANDFI